MSNKYKSYSRIYIYSFPRAGTKLIAQIFRDKGHKVFGEWYNTQDTEIINFTAVRSSEEHIRNLRKLNRTMGEPMSYYHLTQMLFRHHQINSSSAGDVYTIWNANLQSFPMLASIQNIHWILPQRNLLEQLYSWFVSWSNVNYESKKVSNNITVSQELFWKSYWVATNVTATQEWIKNNCSATIVPFHDLIAGQFNGFDWNYSVNSVDEHKNPSELIDNLDQVNDWWNQAENIRIDLEKGNLINYIN